MIEHISEFINNLVSLVGSHGVLGVVSIAGSKVTKESLRFVVLNTLLFVDGETINLTSGLHSTVFLKSDSTVLVLDLGVVQKHTAGSCTTMTTEVREFL